MLRSMVDLQGMKPLIEFVWSCSWPGSGVPGEVRGLEYIHKHYGSLKWAEVVQPGMFRKL